MLSLKGFLGLDGSGWELGLKKAESLSHKFSHNVQHHFKGALIGLFGTAALEAATHSVIQYGARVAQTSEKLGISTDAVQGWDFALKQSGSSIDAASTFFLKLAAARDKALQGNPEAIRAFGKLGLGTGDLHGRLEDIGLKIGEKVKGGDVQQLMAALREVGGRGVGEMIPAMKAGLGEAITQAEKLGIILEAKDVEALHKMEKSAGILAAQFRGPIAKAILFVTDRVSEMADLIKMVIGYPAQFLGALAGGAGFAEARKIADDFARGAIDERIAREKLANLKEHQREHAGEDEEAAETEKERLKRLHDQLKLRERLEEVTRKSDRASMTDSEKINDLIKERNELLKRTDMESQIKAEEMRGEIDAMGHGKRDSKISLTNLQQIGAHISFNPVESELRKNTTATKENTDELRRRLLHEGFGGDSNDGGVTF